MKSQGLTLELRRILLGLRVGGGTGILGVAVKCVDIKRNTSGEGESLDNSYTEARKLGEQTGLDTLVVLAVNGAHLL